MSSYKLDKNCLYLMYVRAPLLLKNHVFTNKFVQFSHIIFLMSTSVSLTYTLLHGLDGALQTSGDKLGLFLRVSRQLPIAPQVSYRFYILHFLRILRIICIFILVAKCQSFFLESIRVESFLPLFCFCIQTVISQGRILFGWHLS